ncbi:hypothetical protein BEWA_020920 [Theileria equi strain WA]|uniref:Uncharacterized protein n=1 Tax=Theileria equi strain WA TaxID=1537102 RepID=L0AUL4_THEEQ|nr:hypothetical protein BEWA_020920 [Theileria equi strain WA]AFZ79245.1 hypothetical protein BEWA_020920 [Theileria equi strain WA]|eukprot:XP_004828911.1 hypothetical protein BEWA_020920 [Theileria equi strain WA]
MFNYDGNQLAQWANNVARALETANGAHLALLLRSKSDKLALDKLYSIDERSFSQFIQSYFAKYDKRIVPGISQFFTDYLKLRVIIAGDTFSWEDVIKKAFKLLDQWMDIYLSESVVEHHWLVPPMYTICNIITKIGTIADKVGSMNPTAQDLDGDEDKDKYMKQVLSNVRSKMGRVRGDETRHSAYIVLLGQSIKGCMQLGNMQMAAGFLKAIESTTINYARALRGPLINYCYYLGKLHMQKEEYFESEEHLSWAFSNCLKDNIDMRRHILECLIVVRIGLGKLPPLGLLRKYGLDHYYDLVHAITSGNVKKFSDTIDTYADTFIREGTILCVEQLKYIAYRTFIKNVKKWWNTHEPTEKNNMLPIGVLTCAIRTTMPQMSDNEMLCICANMIKRSYMKGYISWERLTIVFSAIQPFPPICHQG